MAKEKKVKAITIRLDQLTLEAINLRLDYNRHLTQSDLIRYALDKYLALEINQLNRKINLLKSSS
jgi:hypothetical protein